MVIFMRLLSSLTVSALLFFSSADAFAQRYVPNIDQRLDTLEASVNNLRSRGGSAAASTPAGAAQLQSSLAEIQEELRRLRGANEENNHALNMLKREMKLTAEDYEYRLNALEGNATPPAATAETGVVAPAIPAPATPQAAPATPVAPIKELPFTKPEATPATATDPVGELIEDADNAYIPPTGTTQPSSAADTRKDVSNFTNSREHYNYAVSLMKEKRYDRARESLKSFLKQHGDDRLAGNAHYWLGETYYVANDFPSAADEFRRGFEVQPEGLKAPDNLYKLSKSLINMNKTEQACVVLAQIQKRYKSRNPEVAGLAFETEKNAGCN
jgi:tol-pal system protein YbgF